MTIKENEILSFVTGCTKFLRKIFFYLIFVFSAVVFLSEFGLRLLSKHNYNIRRYTYSPYRRTDFNKIDNIYDLINSSGCSIKPGSRWLGIDVNSKGFVDIERNYEWKDVGYRIVNIGDSFVVAHVPYKFNFNSIMENRLNSINDSDEKIEVINLGVSCMGTQFYKKMYEVEGKNYIPDLVVVNFFVGNDFTDNRTNNKDYKELVKNRLTAENFNEIIEGKSYLAAFLNKMYIMNNLGLQKDKLNNFAVLGNKTVNWEEYDDNEPTFTTDEYLTYEKNMISLYCPELIKDLNPGEALNDIRILNRLINKNSSKLLVVIIPEEMQVNDGLRAEVLNSMGMVSENIDINLPQNILKTEFENSGIEYIDLLEYFRKSEIRDVYKVRDTHFNIKGNEVVGNIIADYIADNYYLK